MGYIGLGLFLNFDIQGALHSEVVGSCGAATLIAFNGLIASTAD